MQFDGQQPAAIAQAADLLAAGQLLAFPTETVYGLGARADDDAAVVQIFRTKGRPQNHPLIVHVVNEQQAALFAADIPPVARQLMHAFWPGPLTVILPRLAGVATAAAGAQATIGLRCPAHPVAQALLAALLPRGVAGLAAPSANRFGRISPTTAAHVMQEFNGSVSVIDGGACAVGIESTIVDCSRGQPVLLRPGMLTRAHIEAAAGQSLLTAGADAPRVSGMLASHYAPTAKLRLMTAHMLSAALQMLAPEQGLQPLKLAVYSRLALPKGARGVRYCHMPQQPQQVAHELFAVLRELDADDVQLIWVEEPPPGPDWDGVRDRLLRAAASG
jgi:L-threonylcarbamoyladenylate synthase